MIALGVQTKEPAGLMRRIVAAMLLALLAGPAAGPLVDSARAGCHMCAKACCCAPKRSADRCRISLPCSAESPSGDTVSPPRSTEPALLPDATVIAETLESHRVHEPRYLLPLSPAQEPPDHPPRLSS